MKHDTNVENVARIDVAMMFRTLFDDYINHVNAHVDAHVIEHLNELCDNVANATSYVVMRMFNEFDENDDEMRAYDDARNDDIIDRVKSSIEYEFDIDV